MISQLVQIILSQEVSAFMAVISFFSNIAILVITGYTFYLTLYSKNLEYVTFSFNGSVFFGTTLSLTIMNKTLHTIPIQNVFIMKKYKDCFYFLEFAKYSFPTIIEGWSVKKIETEPFTRVSNFGYGEGEFNFNEILKDAVIGIKSGQDLIWVKPHKDAPLNAAKEAFKNHNYCMLSVFRRQIEEKVISESVGCVIYVKLKDINKQFVLKKIFGVTGWNDGKSVLLSESLFGYNGLNGAGNTAESISDFIHKTFGINKQDICVQMIDKI